MHFNSFAAVFAASTLFLGASTAGPVAAKRQDEASTSASASGSATATTESSSSITSSVRVEPSAGLIVATLSNGDKTTIEYVNPEATADASKTGDEPTEASKTLTYSQTGQPQPASTNFPECKSEDAKPFCDPTDGTDIYPDKQYFATWNPDFFPFNSTVVIKVLYANDTSEQVWSSDELPSSRGHVVLKTEKKWKQGYDRFNLTLQALNWEDGGSTKAKAYDGPLLTIRDEPPRHYKPPPPTKFHKEGLMIGLPVALGFVVLVVVGLLVGMKKHRQIGLGNIMGRRNRGYGTRKSRRQRLGLGKKGAIRLEEREAADPSYRDAHLRGDSLGSLVSDDGRPHGNAFRDEIQRQKGGRQA